MQQRSLPQKVSAGLVRRAHRLRSRLPHKPFPAILNYHRLDTESFDPWGLSVSPSHFADQLRWLAARRTLLPLSEFAARHERRELPDDAVAVTIDDAYASAAEVALPLLEKLKVPATIFVALDPVCHGKPFWWDELEAVVLGHAEPIISVAGDEIVLGERSGEDRDWRPGTPPQTQRQRAFLKLHEQLSRAPSSQVDPIMAHMRETASVPPASLEFRPLMTPDQIRAAIGSRVEFGSHTRTHPWLPHLDPADQEREIVSGFSLLRDLVAAEPAALAYPFGMADAHCERLAAKAGFTCACATGNIAVSRRSRRFFLPRVHVPDVDAGGLDQLLARVGTA